MGNSQDSGTVADAFHDNKFKLVKQLSDSGYGDIKLIILTDQPDKSKISIVKQIKPKGLNETYSLKKLEERLNRNYPSVGQVMYFGQNKSKNGLYDIIFEYSTESLESLLTAREMNEKELWGLYDFLLDIGLNFEQEGDHYYEICPRDILYIDGKMKLCSQYIYDKYLNSILRYFNDLATNSEQRRLYSKVLRQNVKRLGAFIIECGLRRTTKLDLKNEELIRKEGR